VLRCAVGSEQLTVRAGGSCTDLPWARALRSHWRAEDEHWFGDQTSASHDPIPHPLTRPKSQHQEPTHEATKFPCNPSRPAPRWPACRWAAHAQTTEISFYFPVAVGGPITKLIDQYAADFAKDNPAIKVQPIYAGSYQDTIVKALTAHKAGNAAGGQSCCCPPTCSR
jgi:hypothetical protein